ncbi:MAG: hypothetical protein IPM25_15375 [Chloracidobacterium sp.]|nr:hypothetical protein [Chloracidobacterium sp.]
MKLMCSVNRLICLSIFLGLSIAAVSSNASAQTRKAPAKKPAAKKTETQKGGTKAKVAQNKKASTKSAAKPGSKTTAKNQPKKKAPAKKTTASKSPTAKSSTTAKKGAKPKAEPKKSLAERRAEAARKKKEEARRQAALAEQRRREQAAREARARALAFERGLRTETVQNIAKDITAGEDLDVRRAAVNALGSRAGTVVVMEAKTGKLLTVVNQDWAIRNSFKPCSTIKLVTGVAGLNENAITEDGAVAGSPSGMKLDYALAKSNNGYFQRVGANVGNEKMIQYARELGLGVKTGINAEGETPGKLPFGNNNARIYSHGDDFEVTPLQLAVMVSALSNGGKKVIPQIARPKVEKTSMREMPSGRVRLPAEAIEGVLPGMVGAAEYGTASRGVDKTLGIAGKTGSCIGKGSWVGLFASVAPIEDPMYSVVVITRGQGERGRYAAAIAGQVYQALSRKITRDPSSTWAKRSAPARPDAAETAAGTVADEEEDDEAVAGAEGQSPEPIIVGQPAPSVPKPAVKKLIQKTNSSTPKFPPVVITYDKDPAKAKRPRVVKN